MEYFDQPACDYLSLGFAFDEGYGAHGETNVMAAASLQYCNGTEITSYNFNGTGIEIYDHNPCNLTQSLNASNTLNNTQFVDYVKSIVVNASAMSQKNMIVSENDKNHPDCAAFALDLFNHSGWLKNYSDYKYLFIYPGDKSDDCMNTTKNWNETNDLLGMARESAFQISLDKRCAGVEPAPSTSDNSSLKSGLIVGGVLTGVCVVALIAAYVLHKKDHVGYTQV